MAYIFGLPRSVRVKQSLKYSNHVIDEVKNNKMDDNVIKIMLYKNNYGAARLKRMCQRASVKGLWLVR